MRAPGLYAIPVLAIVWAAAAWADVFCPACGNRYPDSYRYCPKDGFDLDEARQAARSQPAPRGEASPATDAAAPPAAGAPRAAAAEPVAGSWADALPVHVPSVYPDANLGDFSLLQWTTSDPAQTHVFFRAVLHKGEKGHVGVLVSSMPWPSKAGAKAGPPALNDVLLRISAENSRRLEWYDYRDFATSFQIGGRPLLSPFVAGPEAPRISRKNYVINNGTVGCEVAEYAVPRAGRTATHTIKTSQLVPFAFVESTWKGFDEHLRVVLFGTLDEDDLAPLVRAFPRRQ